MDNYNIVLHVDKRDGSITVAFTNAINYALALPDKTFSMVLVVNSAAVAEMIMAENTATGKKLAEAASHGLEVLVCNNALVANGFKPEQLFPQCEVVPAGIVKIVELQQSGYSYIKP